jgi:Predicted nucleoside-diphosphate-sugar epimerases
MALITVIGATGRQGMAQVRQALGAGYDVRAISRRPDALDGAPIDGVERVEVRNMDLYDTATFHDALEGRTISSIPTRCRRARTAPT